MTATSVVDGTKLMFDEKAKQWIADGELPEGTVIPQDDSCGTSGCKAYDAGKCKTKCLHNKKPCPERTLFVPASDSQDGEGSEGEKKPGLLGRLLGNKPSDDQDSDGQQPPPDGPAEKDKLAGVALIQGGEVVKDPKGGNVYVLAKGKMSQAEREKLMAALKERLPMCVFTVVTKPPKAPAKGDKKWLISRVSRIS